MVRKRRAVVKKKRVQKSQSELEFDAKLFFDNQQYKEAINSYKNLLKTEQRLEWRQQLAQAYLRRSEILADKELYQEAAVLWENYSQLCSEQELLGRYLEWLAYSAQYAKIAGFLLGYDDLEELPTSKIYALLGAALLSGEQSIIPLLADNNPVVVYYPFAKEALQAYCQNDTLALERCLKQISFRSPYKDFRSILKALVNLKSDPDAAMQLLKKISPDSPYYAFAQTCQLQNLSDIQNLQDYGKLGNQQRLFVQKLAGLNKTQLNLLHNCQRVLTDYTDKQAFDLVIKNSSVFGETKSQQFALALLPFYPAGKKSLKKFSSFSEFESIRIKALNFEHKDDNFHAIPCWLDCIELLQDRGIQEEALKTALIMRRTATLIGDDDVREVIELLEDSIELDPDDKDSYLRLIALFKQDGDHKKVAYWMTEALKQYPQDVDILMLNISENMRKTAFKKAAGFAQQLLKIDPINPHAKAALCTCHAAHARKMIKLAKYELAAKELAQADAIDMGKYGNGLITTLQGLIAFKTDDKERCKQLLEQGKQLEKGALCGLFRLHIEILNLGLPVTTVMRLYSKPDKKYTATVKEIMHLISMIGLYHQYGNEYVDKAFTKIKALFKQSINQNKATFSQEEFVALCQCFDTQGDFEMLRFISNMAFDRYPESAIFDYYKIYAKIKGKVAKMGIREVMQLEDMITDAKQRNDKRAIEKISNLLNEYEKHRYRSPHWFFDDDDDEEDFDDFPPGMPPWMFGNDAEEDEFAGMGSLEKTMQEVTEMGEEELITFLFDGKMPTPQQILRLHKSGEKGFQAMVMEKILEKAGIDKRLLEGLNLEELFNRL